MPRPAMMPADIGPQQQEAILARMWAKTMPIPECGCWVFMGAVDQGGYGMIRIDSRRVRRAHRVAYEILVGKIPDDKVLDHKCRVRSCWNPDHLRPVSDRENTLLGESFAAIHAAQTHCMRGHEFTSDNTRIEHGSRVCVICSRAIGLRKYYRRKNKKNMEAVLASKAIGTAQVSAGAPVAAALAMAPASGGRPRIEVNGR